MLNFKKNEDFPKENKKKLIKIADQFPIKNGETIKINIESTNSTFTQGVSIDITGYCTMYGKTHKQGEGVIMIFWEDSEVLDIKNIQMTIFTKRNFIWIQNIWEEYSLTGLPYKNKSNIEAMYFEEIKNGRRYFCNDRNSKETFNSIIFTVTRIPE